MKTCSKCRQAKAPKEFAWRHRSRGERSSQCKVCMRKASQRHYVANTIPYKDRAAARASSIKQLLDEAKARPCVDCGVQYPSWVMDFDHVDGDKQFVVSNFAKRVSMRRLREELDKCEVVCANCHRQRTHDRALIA